jgi:site-specific recombinase XerD
VITVRQTKFNKARHVPLHPTTAAALADYARKRDGLLTVAPTTSSFFVSTIGTRLIYSDLAMTFKKLVASARIGQASNVTPRIHDIRHAFAVRTLQEWYRHGDDV